MVDGILKDAIASFSDPGLYEAIVQRDYNVAGQCFLLLRVLKEALQDANVSLHIGLKPVEILYMWSVIRELENSADHARRIALTITKAKITPAHAHSIKRILEEVYEHHQRAVAAYFSNNKKEATTVIAGKREIIEECISFSLKANKREIVEVVEELKKIEKSAVIIARTTVDME